MSLYYLIASLPTLHLGEKPALRMADFLSACATVLAPGDLEALRDLIEHDGAAGQAPFARDWRDRDTELRNAAVRLRARRLQLNPDDFTRAHDGARVYIQHAVAEAFQSPDPLQRERALDMLRWRIADELAGLDPFGLDVVFGYGLRLRLAWRWAALDGDAGAAALDGAVEAASKTDGTDTLHDNTQKAETV